MPQQNNEDPSQPAPAMGFSALSGELSEAEIGGFLSFLFGHVAHRPDVLLLLETAAAVRFLQILAWKGVPAELIGRQRGTADDTRSDDSEKTLEGRRLLQRLAKVIWADLFEYGDFRGCGKLKAKAFLRRHSKTYLVSLDVTRAIKEKGGVGMRTSSPIDDYISRDELARQLGKSVRTLDRWYTMRIGPPRTKVGKSVLYRKASVAKWLEQHEEPALRSFTAQ